VFERFTYQSRRVVVLAQEEARGLHHNYIGTEHILLGLLRDSEGAAATALEAADVTLEGARREVETIIGRGKQEPSGHIPFTPRAKKVLELSLREAVQLGDNSIDTGHILLGLIREGDGVAVQMMINLGADPSSIRQRVHQELRNSPGDAPATSVTSVTLTAPPTPSAPSTPAAARARLEIRHQKEVQGYLDTITSLRAEIARLRTVLDEHGIDPGESGDPSGTIG
jgi:ATP-dependent Clp protease ATP-binding subunit ClpC